MTALTSEVAHSFVMGNRVEQPQATSVMTTQAVICVVDDDESVRESLPDLLKELGFAASAFASADEFLASGTVVVTQCLLLDIAMQRGRGERPDGSRCASGESPG